MEATLGTYLSPFAVEKLVMAENQKLRGGIISKHIRIVKVHFFQGIGGFHCFEGRCCEEGGIPNVRYLFPWLSYPTDMQGKLSLPVEQITPAMLQLFILSLGKEGYDGILTKQQLQEEGGSDITRVDLLVSCLDSQYQKRTYDVIPDCLWRKVVKDKAIYDNWMKIFNEHSEITLGRKIDETKFVQLMSGNVASTPLLDRRGPAGPTLPPPNLPKRIEEIDINAVFSDETGHKDDDIPF